MESWLKDVGVYLVHSEEITGGATTARAAIFPDNAGNA